MVARRTGRSFHSAVVAAARPYERVARRAAERPYDIAARRTAVRPRNPICCITFLVSTFAA